eukprot:3933410-Rhodomonas_salina.4
MAGPQLRLVCRSEAIDVGCCRLSVDGYMCLQGLCRDAAHQWEHSASPGSSVVRFRGLAFVTEGLPHHE